MKQLDKELNTFIADTHLISNASLEQLNNPLINQLISKENQSLIEDISIEEQSSDDVSDSEKDNFITRIFKFIGGLIKKIWDAICGFFRKIGTWLGLVEDKVEEVVVKQEDTSHCVENVITNAVNEIEEKKEAGEDTSKEEKRIIEQIVVVVEQRAKEPDVVSNEAILNEIKKGIDELRQASTLEQAVEVTKKIKPSTDPANLKRNQLNYIADAELYIRNKADYKWFSFDKNYDPFRIQQIHDILSVSAYVDETLQYFTKMYNRKTLEKIIVDSLMKLGLNMIYGSANKKIKELNSMDCAVFIDHFVTAWYKTFTPKTKKYELNVSPNCRATLGNLNTAHKYHDLRDGGAKIRSVRTIKSDYANAFKIVSGTDKTPIAGLGTYDYQTLSVGERTRYLKELAKAADVVKKRAKANELKRIEVPEKELMTSIAKTLNTRLQRHYPFERDRNLAKAVTSVIRDVNDGMVVFSKLLLKVSMEFGKVIDQQTTILNKRMGVQ